MTWALMLATLRGRALPPLPAIAGRVHVLADEPLPDFLLDELLAEGAAPSTVAAQARVPIAVARAWLAAGRRLSSAETSSANLGAEARSPTSAAPIPQAVHHSAEPIFLTSTHARAQEGDADQAPGVSCRRNARAHAQEGEPNSAARKPNPAREGVHLTTRAD